MKRLTTAILVLAITTMAMGSVFGGNAHATGIAFSARIGKILGIVPTVQNGVSNNAPTAGSLYYNGGPVMTSSKVYAIYWVPSGYSVSPRYQSIVNRYFTDVSAVSGKNSQNQYGATTQYSQQIGSQAKSFIQNQISFIGSTVDTNALPPLDPVNCPDMPVAATNGGATPPSTAAGCVTDGQVQHEISTVVKAHNWPVDNHTEFFMFTAQNIGTCFPATVGAGTGGVGTQATAPLCSFSYFCAYHSSYYDSTINPNSEIVYANMPYAGQTNGNPLTCDLGQAPNGDDPAGAEINVTSHEQIESITDPYGTGWWDSNSNDAAAGMEIGDMCARNFGNNQQGLSGAQWDSTINGNHYFMQTEWSNLDNASGENGSQLGCAVNENPTLQLTPNVGYPTGPFKISAYFLNANDSAVFAFTRAGSTTHQTLGKGTANASGQLTVMVKVPANAKPGNATVAVTAKAGSGSATFTVLS